MSTQATQEHRIPSLVVVVSIVAFVLFLLTIPFYLTQLTDRNALELHTTYYVDSKVDTPVVEVFGLPEQAWTSKQQANLGLSPLPHWFKLTIKPSSKKQHRVLMINYGLLDKVDLWFLDAQLGQEKIINSFKTGDSYPFEQRPTEFAQFLFPVPDYPSAITVLIRVETKGPVKVPVEMWDEDAFVEYVSLKKLFMGIFFGFMIAMALSNLFIFASNRNVIFIIYTAYVASIALAVASLHGIGFQYLWSNNIWLQEFCVFIFTNFTLLSIISLTIRLLELQKQAPNIYRILRIIQLIFLAMLAVSLFAPYEVMIRAVLVLLILSTPIILTAGVILALGGSIVARYFCGAWAALLTSGAIVALENFGLYSSFIDSSYLIMVGAITESLLLAFALAMNFSQQLRNAINARLTALKNEQEAVDARDQLIALQEQNKAELEYSIEERTLELEIALRELADKNRDLERLSAIDPLTGLMNRRYFDKRLLAEARRSKRELRPLGLAMLDIDHFKKINDEFGHLCGDHCLKVFAELLKEYVKRPSDVVCRYGGEEFVLILPSTEEEGLKKLLNNIRVAVANKMIMFEGKKISMTVSIGGCSRTMASEDEHEVILGFVDKQLYHAKDSGRNKVIVASY